MCDQPHPARRNTGSSGHVSPDQCLDLAAGLVAQEQLPGIISHMENCVSCEQQLIQVFRLLWRSEILAEGMLAGKTSRDSSVERPSPWRRIRKWFGGPTIRYALSGAAVVLVVLLFLWIPVGDGSVYPQATPLKALHLDLNFRADPNTADDNFRLGLESYDAGDFGRAAERLDRARVPHHLERYRDLFLASALVIDRRYEEALTILEPLSLEVFPDPWEDELRWALSVALYHTGETARAESLIEELATRSGDVAERAREYLDRRPSN